MPGVDPTKAEDDFKITCFWMGGGKPIFEFGYTTDSAEYWVQCGNEITANG